MEFMLYNERSVHFGIDISSLEVDCTEMLALEVKGSRMGLWADRVTWQSSDSVGLRLWAGQVILEPPVLQDLNNAFWAPGTLFSWDLILVACDWNLYDCRRRLNIVGCTCQTSRLT